MVILVACFEAVFEWVAGGGTGRLMDLVTRALKVVDAKARLDALSG